MSTQAGRYPRTVNGMVGAMIVLVLVVVGFVLLRDANRDDPASPVQAVDYTADVDYARRQATFDLVAPPSLPPGWIATSVRYVPGREESWHLGLLTADERYVGLEQADASVESMVEEHVDAEAVEGAPVTVSGSRWQTWTDEGGDLALVRQSTDVTTLVVGHEVPSEELEAFAATLR